MIKINELVKIYSPNKSNECVALKGVNAEIADGEVLAIIGKSASGKSTLLNLLGGIDTPTEGEIIINGITTTALKDNELARFRNENIGIVLQDFGLVEDYSVLENIRLPLAITKLKYKEQIEKCKAILKQMELLDIIKKPVKKLSGGQKQRIAIARAIINNPKILLADEPTGALDEQTSAQIIELLLKLGKEMNMTIIVVTHEAAVAKSCDRILVMRDGILYNE